MEGREKKKKGTTRPTGSFVPLRCTQDDSRLMKIKREKRGGCAAPFFSPPPLANRVILSEARAKDPVGRVFEAPLIRCAALRETEAKWRIEERKSKKRATMLTGSFTAFRMTIA
jgi:hypothetical protein